MTTLISVYNSDGCLGRCDAKCHEAMSPDCDCVCGGMNHGVGHKQAATNTAQHAQSIIKEWELNLNFVPGPTRIELADPQLVLL